MLNNADTMLFHSQIKNNINPYNITKPELPHQGNDNLFIYILNIIVYLYLIYFSRFH